MFNNLMRLIATGMIWGALTLVMVALIVTPNWADFTLIVVGAILGTAAYLSTKSVWKNPESEFSEAEKAKRRTRVERMLARLNDGDLDELRSRLAESDGEMVQLDDLLAGREQPASRR